MQPWASPTKQSKERARKTKRRDREREKVFGAERGKSVCVRLGITVGKNASEKEYERE